MTIAAPDWVVVERTVVRTENVLTYGNCVLPCLTGSDGRPFTLGLDLGPFWGVGELSWRAQDLSVGPAQRTGVLPCITGVGGLSLPTAKSNFKLNDLSLWFSFIVFFSY